jgi:hypothetical protein
MGMDFHPSIRFQCENGCIAKEISARRGPDSELRAIHHHTAATDFAVANEFTFLRDRDCATDRTDNVAVALARNF